MKSTFFSLAIALCLLVSTKASALEVGDTVPEIVLQQINVDESLVAESLTTRHGEAKFVLLEFFATYCGPCKGSLRRFNSFAQDISATTTSRLVFIDHNLPVIQDYVRRNRPLISMQAADDATARVQRLIGISATPTIILIGPNNQVLLKHAGSLDYNTASTIEDLVRQAQ